MKLLLSTLNNVVKNKLRINCNRQFNKYSGKPPWKVLFFGTDDFSLFSLKALSTEYRDGQIIEQLEVVATIKGKENAVKKFSDKVGLKIHQWPLNSDFGEFDVGLVVSFGHLIPESLIKKFPLGMLNVHASLLPRWRGAAPIIYTLAHGDTMTGVTIMRIQPKMFDIGEIVFQKSIDVPDTIKLPELYQKLGILGANELLKTLKEMPDCLNNARQQPKIGVTKAPKINQNFANISWQTMSSTQIVNLNRALTSIYPLTTTWKNRPVKLINISEIEEEVINDKNCRPGYIRYCKLDNCLKVFCSNSKWIRVEKIGITGKKLMSATDFNNGYLKKENNESRCFQ